MSAHENAALARRIYQLFSDDKLDDALELVAEDVEAVLVPFGQTFHGREGFMQFMQAFKGAFPDIRISVTNQVATDESVVSEFTARGTHNGRRLTPAGEIPPTVARWTSSSARFCRSRTAGSRACITTRMRPR